MIFGLFGDLNLKEINKIRPLVDDINSLEETLKGLTKEQVRARIAEIKAEIQKEIADLTSKDVLSGEQATEEDLEKWQKEHVRKVEDESLRRFLPEVFALVRLAAQKTIGERHFDVQMMGAIIMHQGKIAEMRTGEGKTLVATLSVTLNALTGKGVHVITVNDYLSKRDASWMGKVYDYLGLSVAAIGHEESLIYDIAAKKKLDKENQASAEEEGLVYTSDDSPLVPVTRKEAYAADITYGTNNEFGFDFLRDNMAQDPTQLVQRELHYAIVDEVDSILIDEARTPLIISAPAEESASEYQRFAKLVPKLEVEKDYAVDEKMKAVTLTDEGITKMETLLGVKNIYEQGMDLVHYLEEALKARALFQKDKDYVVKDGEVIIVDEFTGRLMPGRRYSEGLHQAIEAKEGVEVQRESLTLATISFQNLFRLYQKLAGMTGTAATEAEEFHKIYKLEVVEVPTNKVNQRQDDPDQIYKSEKGKFDAVVRDVVECNKKGQPVLIGTISIEKNEYLSQILKRAGVKHELLNAKNHEKEAHVVLKAGQRGAVTVATNMAGRGTDIKLGDGVAELGGLHVIGTERHESRRIDNQLRGRTARQGDAGSTQFYVSMEDDLMRIFGGDRMKNIMTALKLPEDQPIEHKMISRAIEGAQKKVEGHNFDIRKHLVEYDDVMNKHREVIYRRRRRILKLSEQDVNNKYLKNQALAKIDEKIRLILNSYIDGDGDMGKAKDEVQRYLGVKLADVKPEFQAMSEFVQKLYDEKEAGICVDVMRMLERAVHLRAIDMMWVDHLTAMDRLRDGIGLRGYGQYDPLVAYKQEAYLMFQRLLEAVDNMVIESIFRVEVAAQPQVKEKVILKGAKEEESGGGFEEFKAKKVAAKESKVQQMMSEEASHRDTKSPAGQKVGRNDLCPCGSGKKYKKCHGK
jgi:preprotein translocase subunit SecA